MTEREEKANAMMQEIAKEIKELLEVKEDDGTTKMSGNG